MNEALLVMGALKRAYYDWAFSEKVRQSKQIQSLNWAEVMRIQKQVKALVKTMSADDRAEFNAKIVADGDNGLLGVS